MIGAIKLWMIKGKACCSVNQKARPGRPPPCSRSKTLDTRWLISLSVFSCVPTINFYLSSADLILLALLVVPCRQWRRICDSLACAVAVTASRKDLLNQ